MPDAPDVAPGIEFVLTAGSSRLRLFITTQQL